MEGADLVAAGIAAGRRPQVIFVREDRAEELAAALGAGAGAFVTSAGAGAPAAGGEAPPPVVYPVDERVAHRLSTLETPPDALAVFPLPERPPLASLRERAATGLVVYADGIADPGNMGTLLRAAVAFGAAALAAAPGSADLYGPKTVRASMGAVFGVPLWPELPLRELLEHLAGAEVYGLAAHGGTPIGEARRGTPAVLVVGAERPGLSAEALACVTQLVTIPLAPAAAGAVESLNAGVAGAIALYEFSRRSAGASEDPPRRSPAPEEG
ncbi:MAG TPA: RNA methyltransferase [Thermoleophilia bacterium]|nr:RNA methyltransferase [Thermoleophilia bacterium]